MPEENESMDQDESKNMLSYNDMLKSFRFPDNFLEIVEEKMKDGLDIQSSYGQTFFQCLENADLLSPLDIRYHKPILTYIRTVLDEIEIQYSKPVDGIIDDPDLFFQYANENFGMILVGFRALLKQLYQRNLVDKKINELNGIVTSTRGQVQDATKIAEDAKKDSMIDAKTGIPNMRAYTTDIAELSNQSNVPMALLVFDIDKFKDVNDRYGYNSGDKVIKKLADIIAAHSREEGKYYRWGGEEFAVVIPLIDGWNEAEVIKMADEVREKLSEVEFNAHVIHSGKIEDFKKTCSCGIAFGLSDDLLRWKDDDEKMNGGELFSVVNKAIKSAKDNGRNQTVVNHIKPEVI